MQQRHVFFISDGTGITAETLGHSLVTQFEGIDFISHTVPYMDTLEKAKKTARKIDEVYANTKVRPLIFATLVNPKLRVPIAKSQGKYIDFFKAFIKPLEEELGLDSSYTIGRSHSIIDTESYKNRIDAVNYALAHDDGLNVQHYGRADIILIGVSRCGKTPTCLYLALQFGILAANYPLVYEGLNSFRLPDSLRDFKDKLFGLSIDPTRLSNIRQERRPHSEYASLKQCRLESSQIEAMYLQEMIAYFSTTRCSVEEISTKILAMSHIQRRVF